MLLFNDFSTAEVDTPTCLAVSARETSWLSTSSSAMFDVAYAYSSTMIFLKIVS